MRLTSRSTRRGAAGLALGLGLGALAVLGHEAPLARASPTQISIMMDDDSVLYAPESRRLDVLQQMKRLGVDYVRATVLWSVVARGTRNPRTHPSFDPTNPRAYPPSNWYPYDQLLKDAAQVGLSVYFNITGPGPAWAMGTTTDQKLKKAYLPDAVQFGNFVRAVGTRYSGNYPFGAGNPVNYPRMSMWSIWNEPNWPTWLAPQTIYSPDLHRVIPYSPILYRRLVYAARQGLDASGHQADAVMIGETQPHGGDPTDPRTPMRPAEFIRELFCVDHALRPLHGVEASGRRCGIFHRLGPMRISDFAHHPYTTNQPPGWTDSNPDSITLGNISALPRLLDGIAANTHRLPSGLPVMITEMGWSSNPPNPYRGVPLAEQAAWLNESDYLAWRQPRVMSMAQFLLRDSPPRYGAPKGSFTYWSTFQTGLAYLNGKRKPSYYAYAMPVWIHPGHDSHGHGRVRLWTQVRFRKDPTGPALPDYVVFQFKPRGAKSFHAVTGRLALSPYGFVEAIQSLAPYARGGTFQAYWVGPVVPFLYFSRTVAFP